MIPILRLIVILWLSASVFSSRAYGQEAKIVYTNEQAIDPDRYSDIKGDPMFFPDWAQGSIMRNDAMIFEDVTLNYNGYNQNWEVRTDKGMIELDGNQLLRVVVQSETNENLRDHIPTEELAFQRNLHPRFEDKFAVILYRDYEVMLVKEFWVDVSSHTVQTVGKAVKFNRFNRKELYYLKANGALTQLRLKKSDVLELLDHSAVKDYVKKNKMKLNSEEELVEVVSLWRRS